MIKNIKKNADKVGRIQGVEAVYLFGSHARGEQNTMSDVDICIIGNLNEKNKYKAYEEFSDDKFDVSFFSRLPIWMRFRVLSEGKALFVKNKEVLEEIYFKTIKEYLAFSPVLDKLIKMRFGRCMTCKE
jgi:uncharacterized protein